jgi:hypothetical protein
MVERIVMTAAKAAVANKIVLKMPTAKSPGASLRCLAGSTTPTDRANVLGMFWSDYVHVLFHLSSEKPLNL